MHFVDHPQENIEIKKKFNKKNHIYSCPILMPLGPDAIKPALTRRRSNQMR